MYVSSPEQFYQAVELKYPCHAHTHKRYKTKEAVKIIQVNCISVDEYVNRVENYVIFCECCMNVQGSTTLPSPQLSAEKEIILENASRKQKSALISSHLLLSID